MNDRIDNGETIGNSPRERHSAHSPLLFSPPWVYSTLSLPWVYPTHHPWYTLPTTRGIPYPPWCTLLIPTMVHLSHTHHGAPFTPWVYHPGYNTGGERCWYIPEYNTGGERCWVYTTRDITPEESEGGIYHPGYNTGGER